MDVQTATSEVLLPRVTIKFCTQCKWMLRAAYFAQELLSTFSTAIGEVALQPATGGLFSVHVEVPNSRTHTENVPTSTAVEVGKAEGVSIRRVLLWDRKTEGGFPETKELKRRLRDVIEPGRNLGHVDRGKAGKGNAATSSAQQASAPAETGSEDVGREDAGTTSFDRLKAGAEKYHADGEKMPDQSKELNEQSLTGTSQPSQDKGESRKENANCEDCN